MTKKQSPQIEPQDAIDETVEQNKTGVNPIDDAAALIDATPGRSANDLPPAATVPSHAVAAAPPPVKGKRGRPSLTPEEKAARKRNRVQAPPVNAIPGQPQKIPLEATARMVNQAYESSLIAVLGPEAMLLEQEKMVLDASLADYMRLKNYDIPPGLALAFCYATVTASKLQKPTTKERAAGIFIALKNKFGKKRKSFNVKSSKESDKENEPTNNSSGA